MLASTVFEPQARYEAAQLGAPDLRLVVVPHPFGTMPRQQVEELAATVAEQVREALTR